MNSKRQGRGGSPGRRLPAGGGRTGGDRAGGDSAGGYRARDGRAGGGRAGGDSAGGYRARGEHAGGKGDRDRRDGRPRTSGVLARGPLQGGSLFVAASRDLLPYLKQELSSLGYRWSGESSGGVSLEGGMKEAMHLNLHLRTAHHVFLLLGEFRASDPAELYREASKVRWEGLIPGDGYVCVYSVVDTPAITDGRFANLKCKDAIVDRIRGKTGKRPDSGSVRNRTVVHLYWKENRCSLYLDTSGETLSKRSYRKVSVAAPMRENLAAAVVLATGWKPVDPFVNPMCGSGTLAIEAGLIAVGRAPGVFRDNFGFMHVTGFDRGLWESMKREARSRERNDPGCRIIATDIDRAAVEATRANARNAGVDELIEVFPCDFRDTPVPQRPRPPAGTGSGAASGGPPGPASSPRAAGVVVLNPEYGVRTGESGGLADVYSGIGDFFKTKCSGYRGYVFSGNFDLLKKVGLRTSRKLVFHNGDIECRLHEYELYEGTRKKKYAAGEGEGQSAKKS